MTEFSALGLSPTTLKAVAETGATRAELRVAGPAALLVQPEWITKSRRGPVNITSDGYSVRAHLMETPEGLPPSWPVEPAPDTLVVLEVDREAFLADFVRVLSGH